jgi:hypothetical protein
LFVREKIPLPKVTAKEPKRSSSSSKSRSSPRGPHRALEPGRKNGAIKAFVQTSAETREKNNSGDSDSDSSFRPEDRRKRTGRGACGLQRVPRGTQLAPAKVGPAEKEKYVSDKLPAVPAAETMAATRTKASSTLKSGQEDDSRRDMYEAADGNVLCRLCPEFKYKLCWPKHVISTRHMRRVKQRLARDAAAEVKQPVSRPSRKKEQPAKGDISSKGITVNLHIRPVTTDESPRKKTDKRPQTSRNEEETPHKLPATKEVVAASDRAFQISPDVRPSRGGNVRGNASRSQDEPSDQPAKRRVGRPRLITADKQTTGRVGQEPQPKRMKNQKASSQANTRLAQEV